jgi:hypothetical protein
MNVSCIVTTSWDDGSVLDLRLARLLDKYRLHGTFYVPVNYRHDALVERDLKDIAARHEIGAHGLNHKDLTQLPREQMSGEISRSKLSLESLLMREITIFCYPFGYFNETVKRCARDCGFVGARTTDPFLFSFTDPFEFGVTTSVYPFPFGRKSTWKYPFSRTLIRPFLLAYPTIRRLHLPPKSLGSWKSLVKELFLYTLREGLVFHLWGHSWEIEKYKMWKSLEEVFEFISQRDNVRYLNNTQCLTTSAAFQAWGTDENSAHQ